MLEKPKKKKPVSYYSKKADKVLQEHCMKCNLCKYMENDSFPFAKISGVIYLDTEDCYDDGVEDGLIKVEYCLKCGKKINTFEIG